MFKISERNQNPELELELNQKAKLNSEVAYMYQLNPQTMCFL